MASKVRLEADLCDKQHAIEVDMAVLLIPVNGADDVAAQQIATLRRNGVGQKDLHKTVHTWARLTEENLATTTRALSDSCRLRKAIRYSLANSRAQDHSLSSVLNSSMLGKINQTQSLRRTLAVQLDAVHAEESALQSQWSTLASALEANRGPLEQAKARWLLRRARTERETVQDSAEAALSAEIAHLNSATQSLSAQMAAADHHLQHLSGTARLLAANMEDKDVSISIDEAVLMLDGRLEAPHPPPSSVASFALSSVSVARSATLRRIAMLEDEVCRARSERMGLEAGVSELRARQQPGLGSRPGTGLTVLGN